MKELVIISGKGGTGKTSIAASFAVLAGNAVTADCDVDAADLHLVLAPQVQQRGGFRSGHEARIRTEDCGGCGVCARLCRFGAVGQQQGPDGAVTYAIDPLACEGCGLCARYCPQQAIDLKERDCGEWFVSETRCGPLVHASLDAAAENSGKLVSLVRDKARTVAKEGGRELIIVDGAPGIGCPVIASLTGATAVLIVTEPTVSGAHDLERVAAVARHFAVPAWVCVNKWDLNPGMTEQIEATVRRQGMQVAGRVRYDRDVTAAQVAARTIVEFTVNGAGGDVRALWLEMGRCLTV
ncbi:MAG TPA: ATP-binding protein [Phycisphaerae bacterium]|nr:ATP-binding protein [Phycisphaerae bacterium]HNU45065.1 ATP-binding protein [Phycisphaerae bacterium]